MFSPHAWLPVLVASPNPNAGYARAQPPCTPYFKPNEDVVHFVATASMVPAFVTLDGVQIGHPVDTRPGEHPCDQIASVGVDDGTVRGVSSHIMAGFSVPIIGNVGELIEFRYREEHHLGLGGRGLGLRLGLAGDLFDLERHSPMLARRIPFGVA